MQEHTLAPQAAEAAVESYMIDILDKQWMRKSLYLRAMTSVKGLGGLTC